MLITAVCPTTKSRNKFIPMMVRCFLAQSCQDSELLVVSEDVLAIPSHPRIRVIKCPAGMKLGEKRNYSVKHALGDTVATWDSDDWYGPEYLADMLNMTAVTGKPFAGYNTVTFLREDGSKSWIYELEDEGYVCAGNSLSFRRDMFRHFEYPEIDCGEDGSVIGRVSACNLIATMSGEYQCVVLEHGDNTWKHEHPPNLWTENDAELTEMIFRTVFP
jgi:glycosyltransferase involved in cell wall biosynthesis